MAVRKATLSFPHYRDVTMRGKTADAVVGRWGAFATDELINR